MEQGRQRRPDVDEICVGDLTGGNTVGEGEDESLIGIVKAIPGIEQEIDQRQQEKQQLENLVGGLG